MKPARGHWDGILRAFARRTSATPCDPWAIVGEPGLFLPDGIREVRVCAVFTWDLPECERLARVYRDRLPRVPVAIGGPATGMRGEEHVPGLFTGDGYVITSRGCPNRCWFCSVWKREGDVRTFPIRDGWNVLDDNLLACPEEHIRAVFAMLARQRREVAFTGGLEARLLTNWHADLLAALRPQPRIFFAYDTPDDWDPMVSAVLKLTARGISTKGHRVLAYVLCGFPRDTLAAADKRMRDTDALGVFPRAMLWRDPKDMRGDKERRQDPVLKPWFHFAWTWARPTVIAAQCKSQHRQTDPARC